ncbi:MAG: hypothetical protein HKP58_01935 [Desulfatitalea sp.]|nr:hypothetical protein [Desulfatitalea sp.]NNJ99148.1 hypothetical protein [Desulfatitalea sp.]
MASNPGQVPAGGRDKISVVVHTANRGGQHLTKRVRVFTDDPKRPDVALIVTGKVEAYVTVTPSRVRLIGRTEEELVQQVRITPGNGKKVTITDVKARGGEHIRLDLKPLGKDASAEGYLLTVTVTKKEAGNFGDFIELKTDLKEQPTIGIPVSGRLMAVPKKPVEGHPGE